MGQIRKKVIYTTVDSPAAASLKSPERFTGWFLCKWHRILNKVVKDTLGREEAKSGNFSRRAEAGGSTN